MLFKSGFSVAATTIAFTVSALPISSIIGDDSTLVATTVFSSKVSSSHPVMASSIYGDYVYTDSDSAYSPTGSDVTDSSYPTDTGDNTDSYYPTDTDNTYYSAYPTDYSSSSNEWVSSPMDFDIDDLGNDTRATNMNMTSYSSNSSSTTTTGADELYDWIIDYLASDLSILSSFIDRAMERLDSYGNSTINNNNNNTTTGVNTTYSSDYFGYY
ncbi:hypothetical protein DASC09_014580 [Saccharomycopsis crataegensis]|uniref:Uncharacterized protein n=1 Tax=Saccharomycopsis crataegensis TaxID=43959 RepID=A0AAV5QH83_9ASCO|nr:hypothetical protein DASC09_014580 [Saccharomycopsis crataegensis]